MQIPVGWRYCKTQFSGVHPASLLVQRLPTNSLILFPGFLREPTGRMDPEAMRLPSATSGRFRRPLARCPKRFASR